MSKKKDRLNTNYRNCPICGKKTIIIYTKKFFKIRNYIHCYYCHKDVRVEVANIKATLDYIEVQNWYRKNI